MPWRTKKSYPTLGGRGLYMKAVENLDVWFTGKYLDVPATIEGGMKIDRLIRMPYSGNTTGTFASTCYIIALFIQDHNDLEYEGVWGDANAISEIFTESVPGITLALNNLKDIDVLYCGSYVTMSYRNGEFQIGHLMCLCFIKTTGGEETVKQYCIYTFQFAYDFELWINKAIPKIERAFPCGFQYAIREDGQFCFTCWAI